MNSFSQVWQMINAYHSRAASAWIRNERGRTRRCNCRRARDAPPLFIAPPRTITRISPLRISTETLYVSVYSDAEIRVNQLNNKIKTLDSLYCLYFIAYFLNVIRISNLLNARNVCSLRSIVIYRKFHIHNLSIDDLLKNYLITKLTFFSCMLYLACSRVGIGNLRT